MLMLRKSLGVMKRCNKDPWALSLHPDGLGNTLRGQHNHNKTTAFDPTPYHTAACLLGSACLAKDVLTRLATKEAIT